jgi:outer membrane protein assembly factor BamB
MKRWLVPLSLFLLAVVADAASTATWEMNNYRDFIRGRFTGVSLSRDGRIALAPRLDTVLASDQPVIWSIVQASDGTIYAASGHRGQVFQVGKSGQTSVLWTADEPEVFALALSPSGILYAATSPNGKIYRIEKGKATEFFAPNVTYIWSLAFAKDGTLYAGTGDQGLVFRVDTSGKGEPYYETGQAHVTCLAIDAQGRVLAGSEPNGIIYRIEARNRAFVLFDAGLTEIRAIMVAPDGAIYAAAQGGASMRRALAGSTATQSSSGAGVVPSTSTTVTVTEQDTQAGIEIKPRTDAARQVAGGTTPQVSAQFSPVSDFPGVEKSALYRIGTDNTVETLWSSKDENVYDLVSSLGQLVFSTDSRGRIYRLSADGKVTLLAQTNEGEATRLLDSPAGLLAATGDAGKIYRLAADTASSGVFESPVHDASTVARWGRLSWIAETGRDSRLAFFTRTGNSMRPDQTWSDWSPPLIEAAGTRIPSPNARYIQWKAELSSAKGSSPVLDSVTVAYLPQNTPPSVKNITVSTMISQAPASTRLSSTQSVSSSYSITVSETGETVPPTSAGTPAQALTRSFVRQLQITWQAEDPDSDRLDFKLEFRGEGEREWKLIKANLRETSYVIDSDVLADGRYLFRVTASDAPDNTPSTAKETELISAPVLVDNSPPVVTAGAPRKTGDRVEIEFEAVDAASTIRRAEYSLDAGYWTPAESVDGILDSPREVLRVRLEKLPPGEHLVTLRVYDSAENVGLAKVVLR